jgi:hypothetical protein
LTLKLSTQERSHTSESSITHQKSKLTKSKGMNASMVLVMSLFKMMEKVSQWEIQELVNRLKSGSVSMLLMMGKTTMRITRMHLKELICSNQIWQSSIKSSLVAMVTPRSCSTRLNHTSTTTMVYSKCFHSTPRTMTHLSNSGWESLMTGAVTKILDLSRWT